MTRFPSWIRRRSKFPRSDQLKALVIDDWIPDPSIGAGAPRAAQLLRALSKAGAAITHFSTTLSPNGGPAITRTADGVTYRSQHGSRSQTLRNFLDQFHDDFSVIFVSRPHNMRDFKLARSQIQSVGQTPFLIYDAEAIFAHRGISQRAIAGRPLSDAASQVLIDSEIGLADAADVVLTVNEDNAALFRSAGCDDVRVLRHAVSENFGHATHSERETILFVGPTYSEDTPNTDSVVWFVEQVLPIMRRQGDRPFRLTLVGRSTAQSIASMSSDNIDARGPLQNLNAEYSRARVFIAPTRFAAGIPLKVYEAAAHGVPCLITSLLAAQLDWRDANEALVADTPELFAQQCLRLMDDEALWTRIRIAAYERTIRDCDWTVFSTTIQSVLPARRLSARVVRL